jgi:hypothetical protein
MNDITQCYRFQRILVEASQYRVLPQIFESDPSVGPATAALLRDCFRTYRDDAADLREIANRDPESFGTSSKVSRGVGSIIGALWHGHGDHPTKRRADRH